MDLSRIPTSDVFVDSAEALGQSPISAVIDPDAGRPADPQAVRPRDARVARRRLVQHAVEFLSSHAAEGVRIGELSRVAGVSERTLRKAFHTVHGLSPKQFDLRQRLFGARRALCHVDATRKTVTTIACEFGFFELGRFSRAYKAAFGESPSQTIKMHTAVARGAW
jgi:transcriptional regulator GlxA family with amidase domain